MSGAHHPTPGGVLERLLARAAGRAAFVRRRDAQPFEGGLDLTPMPTGLPPEPRADGSPVLAPSADGPTRPVTTTGREPVGTAPLLSASARPPAAYRADDAAAGAQAPEADPAATPAQSLNAPAPGGDAPQAAAFPAAPPHVVQRQPVAQQAQPPAPPLAPPVAGRRMAAPAPEALVRMSPSPTGADMAPASSDQAAGDAGPPPAGAVAVPRSMAAPASTPAVRATDLPRLEIAAPTSPPRRPIDAPRLLRPQALRTAHPPSAAPTPAPATLQVTIGTVEIRAVPAPRLHVAPPPAGPARREGAQPLALDDYLARRGR